MEAPIQQQRDAKLWLTCCACSCCRMKSAWLAAECPQKRSSPEYDLIATVSHLGTNSTSGHYTANVRQPNGKWLCFDDSNVTMIPLSKVLEEAAYLLIYQLTAPLE